MEKKELIKTIEIWETSGDEMKIAEKLIAYIANEEILYLRKDFAILRHKKDEQQIKELRRNLKFNK